MSHEDRWLLILSVKKEKDKREFLYLCVCVSVCEGVCVDICVVKTNKVYTLQFHKKKDKRGMNSQYMFLQLSKTGFLKNFGEILIRISLSLIFCQRRPTKK